MALNISKGNIGNALHSVAPDHVVAVAHDIFDETRQKYQDEINAEMANGDRNKMLRSKDWAIAGGVVYDDNEIPVSYNIVWADGTAGTVAMSNFNSDVFEYSTITATYGNDVTIVYTLTYDDNGFVINETINIQ